MQQIKSIYIYIYIALAFVGCLPSYHLWKKTPWLGVFPHQQTTKGSSLGPALKLSAVHDLSEKLEEDLKQVPSHLSKDEDKSNVWLLWYKVIYIVIYVYIYICIESDWIWRLSWRDPLQKPESVLLMKSPQYVAHSKSYPWSWRKKDMAGSISAKTFLKQPFNFMSPQCIHIMTYIHPLIGPRYSRRSMCQGIVHYRMRWQSA